MCAKFFALISDNEGSNWPAWAQPQACFVFFFPKPTSHFSPPVQLNDAGKSPQ
jgi:hypothetical protein